MASKKIEWVRQFLQPNGHLAKELQLTGLEDNDLRDIMPLIKEANLPHLTSLSFTSGRITNAGLKYFEQLPKQIKFVDLHGNNLTTGAAQIITELFKTVEHLNLSNNRLTDLDIEHFSIHATQRYLLTYHNSDTSSELAFELDKKLYENKVKHAKENGESTDDLSEPTPFWTLPCELIEEIHVAMEEQSTCTARHGIKFNESLNFISADFKLK